MIRRHGSANALGSHLDLEVGIDLALSGSVSGVERLYSANDTAYNVLALQPSQTAKQFEDFWIPVTAVLAVHVISSHACCSGLIKITQSISCRR